MERVTDGGQVNRERLEEPSNKQDAKSEHVEELLRPSGRFAYLTSLKSAVFPERDRSEARQAHAVSGKLECSTLRKRGRAEAASKAKGEARARARTNKKNKNNQNPKKKKKKQKKPKKKKKKKKKNKIQTSASFRGQDQQFLVDQGLLSRFRSGSR